MSYLKIWIEITIFQGKSFFFGRYIKKIEYSLDLQQLLKAEYNEDNLIWQ